MLLRRWYVVAFIVGYFAVSVPERGWKASVRFFLIAFGVAFAAEYSSTRNGFPFTHYAYTGATHHDEVYLSNIPAFVPASYAVMIYAGRSLATFLVRSRVALAVAGAVATMAVDLVVDPVAVRGSQWFLGDLFHYASHGPWFGVPLGNFGGWILVALVVIGVDLAAGRREPVRPAPRGALLATAVLAFNTALAFAIGATAVGFAAVGVMGMMGATRLLRPGTPEVIR
ncbi:MAG: carotenoid biosynthesis protein [Actinomycetota bacterium]